jgi:hypothetical protein
MCRVFQQKFIEKNERLARKCYQLFKEQAMVNYDDVNKNLLFLQRTKKKRIFFSEISRTNSNFFC